MNVLWSKVGPTSVTSKRLALEKSASLKFEFDADDAKLVMAEMALLRSC